ncbi:adenylyl-sulfate kinase [Nocardioides sp. SYSU D00038]|uniref:adenylyl-sulfate kinase n=1 Tax=Nocardioides sp. SYSU D00038 TaxID=2812554 RepID=UPI0019686042|nr:adenylyl-sulfate kinase [Nocardioides sp. SYSU D00038]
MSSAPVPQHCPTPRELDDLELLVSGALVPLTEFNRPGSPVTLELPPSVDELARTAGTVELVDPEGLPLARVAWPEGRIQPLTHAAFGPFRHLRLTPRVARRRHGGRVFVPVCEPITTDQLGHLATLGPVALVAMVGQGTAAVGPVTLVRATLAAAELLPDAVVIAVPLASHADPDDDAYLLGQIMAAYAEDDPVEELDPDDSPVPAPVAAVLLADQPPPDRQGLVLFFTGLSGSGKSTLARAFTDHLLELGTRTVTSLDGDVVRRNLSAGLTFSKADRETNIRRIGWVAAEIARHGGVAVVSPIAPFDETRQQVRAMVEDAGGAFFLVHVATPLEECERRDRKGLYAKARRGEIPEFTGISSPYEEPRDADVRVDTTGRSIDEALTDVLVVLRERGYLDLLGTLHPEQETEDDALQVLYVCTANICRSPAMELLSRRVLPDSADVVFSSAGTHGHVDKPVDPEILRSLPADVVSDDFRSRQLSTRLLEEADLVLTAETAHRDFILEEQPGMFRKVFTLGQFANAVERVGADLPREELLRMVAESRPTAEPAGDVPDPYRRGRDAAVACTARIEGLLARVLPALSAHRGDAG